MEIAQETTVTEAPAQEVNTETTTALETPVEEKKPEPKGKDFAAKFAQLKKFEREMRQKEQSFKSEREKLEQELAEYRSVRELASKNPAELLKKFDLDYQKLTDYYLNDGKPTPERKIEEVESKLEKLQRELQEKEEAIKQREQEALVKEQERQIQQYKEQFKSFVETNKDDFELLAIRDDQADLVFETMTAYYENNKKVLTVREACQMIENYLFEDAKKLASVKKLKALMGEKDSQTKPDENPAQKPVNEQKKPVFTLSNKVNADATIHSPTDPLNETERLRRAAAMLRKG